MKRAVSVITTILEKWTRGCHTKLAPTLNKDKFGTVKTNRMGLETLDEENDWRRYDVRNSTIVNRA